MSETNRYFPLYTPTGKGALYVPLDMTPSDLALIKQQVADCFAVLVALAATTPQEPKEQTK
jgi:hypothetical protein